MTQSDIAWPPPYHIKKHRLAKYVKLKAMDDQSLLVTIPVRFNVKKIPGILEENRMWILKHLAKVSIKKADILPEQIILKAFDETWTIEYLTCDAKTEMFIRPDKKIIFTGKRKTHEFYKRNLIAFIRHRAKIHLGKTLQNLSQQTRLQFDSLTIRDQKTLWGSCTVNKCISLNYKLLFLPAYLLQHVIIHELCHTIYLDHSDKFWSLVEKFDPAFRTHKRELRKADQYIPEWI